MLDEKLVTLIAEDVLQRSLKSQGMTLLGHLVLATVELGTQLSAPTLYSPLGQLPDLSTG